MNWGKWIIASFVFFVGFIATIVTICMKQDVSLVSKDYYKDEIAFQRQIERKQNFESLPSKPEVTVAEGKLLVRFPQNVRIASGDLKLFRSSNARLDQNFVLNSSSDELRIFELKNVQRGAYRIKMNWTMDGKEYYMEKSISI